MKKERFTEEGGSSGEVVIISREEHASSLEPKALYTKVNSTIHLVNKMRQETLLKIIGLMRTNLDKGMTILEISKKLNIGYRPAYLHVAQMEKEGILMVEKVGNAKQCTLNLTNPKTTQLLASLDLERKEGIFKNNLRLKNIMERLITNLTEQHIPKIHSIVLFGSHAKGTATRQSDIDVLFILADLKDKPVREAIERECASVQYSHNSRVNPLIVDITEFRKMLEEKDMNVGKEVRKDGISLYGHELFWRINA